MKYYLYIILIVLFLLISCAPTKEIEVQKSEEKPMETPFKSEPSIPTEQPEEKKEIPADIKEVLEKGKIKLSSYSYNYKSPPIEEPYKIYVKESKIKIIPPEIANVGEGKFYNTIYIDTEKKTAEAYCIGYSECGEKTGKVKDLDYEESYIKTPIDWLQKITQAEKIDERQVEGRDSLYLNTNIGKIIVEKYYGFLYRIEDDKEIWEFSDAAFNSLTDADVTPS